MPRQTDLTLQSLLSVPEFLQLCEVLVEDEDFGDAEGGRTHVHDSNQGPDHRRKTSIGTKTFVTIDENSSLADFFSFKTKP